MFSTNFSELGHKCEEVATLKSHNLAHTVFKIFAFNLDDLSSVRLDLMPSEYRDPICYVWEIEIDRVHIQR